MINAIYEESQQRAAELGQQTAEDLLAARLQFYEDERVRCKMKRPSRLSEHDYIKDCLAAFHAGATFGSTQAREWECWWRTAHANIDQERYVLSILDYYSRRFEEHRPTSGRATFRQEMSNAEFDAIKSVLLKQSARIDHLLQELCDLQSGAASTTYVADSRRFWWIVRSLLKRDDKASAWPIALENR